MAAETDIRVHIKFSRGDYNFLVHYFLMCNLALDSMIFSGILYLTKVFNVHLIVC